MVSMHKNRAQNELKPRNVVSILTDGIRMLAAKIKESEHPEWSDLEKDMNEKKTQT